MLLRRNAEPGKSKQCRVNGMRRKMTKDVRRTGAREERGKKEWPRSGSGRREGGRCGQRREE